MKYIYIYITITLSLLFPILTLAAAPSASTGQTTVTSTYSASQSTWTVGYTMPSNSDTNICLIAIIQGHAFAGLGTIDATYNGVSMTRVIDMAPALTYGYSVFYMATSTPGIAHNVVYTFNTGARTYGKTWIKTYQNCAQSSPIDVSDQTSSAGVTALNKSLTTTLNDDLVIGTLSTADTLETNLLGNNPQTDLAVLNDGLSLAGTTELVQATAGTVNTGYTWTTSVSADYYVWALKGVAGGSSSGGTITGTTTAQQNYEELLSTSWIMFLFLGVVWLVSKLINK